VSSTTITSRHRYRRRHEQDGDTESVVRVPGLVEGIDFRPRGSVSPFNVPLQVDVNFTHWLCPITVPRRLDRSCSCSGRAAGRSWLRARRVSELSVVFATIQVSNTLFPESRVSKSVGSHYLGVIKGHLNSTLMHLADVPGIPSVESCASGACRGSAADINSCPYLTRAFRAFIRIADRRLRLGLRIEVFRGTALLVYGIIRRGICFGTGIGCNETFGTGSIGSHRRRHLG
jgi:hypothetical protein